MKNITELERSTNNDPTKTGEQDAEFNGQTNKVNNTNLDETQEETGEHDNWAMDTKRHRNTRKSKHKNTDYDKQLI